jgi:phosphoribosylpyrophosphate synthetase
LYDGAVESLAKRRLVLVTGRCHPALAQDIAEQLGIQLTEANVREFANGEFTAGSTNPSVARTYSSFRRTPRR